MSASLRNALAPALLAACLSACSDVSQVPNSDVVKVGAILYHEVLGGQDSVPRERVAAIPYATLGVRLGSGDQAMFVLGSETGNDLHWIGGKRFAITTRNGRIVRTFGLVHNLTGAAQSEPAKGGTQNYLYDFAEFNLYGIVVQCADRDAGPEHIVIIEDPHETRHVVEDCNAAQLDWTFSNDFWIDASTGYVWKSRQYVQPDLDPVELESLRPAQ